MKKEEQNIISVDYCFVKNRHLVSLYVPKTNASEVVDISFFSDEINSNYGEKIAIINALLYICNNNITKGYIICDNQHAVTNPFLVKKAHNIGWQIEWSPKELNKISDKLTKLKTTVNDKHPYNLFNHIKMHFKDYL